MTWIVTFSGKRFDLFDPKPEQVCIEDIAHALSLQARWNGHTREFYSVAQHSYHVARLVSTVGALMHDAAEAYIGDIVRPLKHAIHAFNPSSGYEREDIPQVESRILKAIGEALDFDPAECEAGTVKQADLVMLMTERRDLFDLAASTLPWPGEWPEPHKRRLVPWTSRQAECEFLYAFRELKSIAAARA